MGTPSGSWTSSEATDVPAVYAESSAVLAWLFGEPRSVLVRAALDEADAVVTATLTSVEARRALVRAAAEDRLAAATLRRLAGLLDRACAQWAMVELTATVRQRAAESFPVEPVRSLDAVHLASALEAQQLFPGLAVLSLDRRILDNLEPLGLAASLAP